MKKVALDLDELEVDSFEVTERVQESGTMKAAWSDDSVCPTTGPSERRFCY